jgi:hypothetical protein
MSPNVPPSAAVRFRAIALALALALAVALLPGAASAWGPFDGSYQLTLDDGGGPYIIYLVVIQDSLDIAVIFLAPACPQSTIECISPTWNYGQGFPTGAPNQWSGQTLAANGTQLGTFTFQFNVDLVSGTTTNDGYPDSSASGFRLWGGNPAP